MQPDPHTEPDHASQRAYQGPAPEYAAQPFVVVNCTNQSPSYRNRVLTACSDCRRGGLEPILVLFAEGRVLDAGWLAFLRCPLLLPRGATLAAVETPLVVVGKYEFDGVHVIADYSATGARLVVPSPSGTSWVHQFAYEHASLPPRWRRAVHAARAFGKSRAGGHIGTAAVVAGSLLVLGGSLLPSPYSITAPDKPVRAADMVRSPEARYTGTLEFAVVKTKRPKYSELPYWWWRARGDVTMEPAPHEPAPRRSGARPRPAVLNKSAAQERVATDSSALVAALVAADRPLGTVRGGGVLVRSAAPNSGLRAGDVIIEANRRPVRSMLDLAPIIKATPPGGVVGLTLSDRRPAKLWLVPDVVAEDGFRLEASLDSVNLSVQSGVRADFVDQGVQRRTSGGLAMSLHLYQALTGTDLIRGRHIVATGAVDPTGQIGAVEGIRQKLLSVKGRRITMFLVSKENEREAQFFGEKYGVPVVGVGTLSDAIRILRLPTYAESVQKVRPSLVVRNPT